MSELLLKSLRPEPVDPVIDVELKPMLSKKMLIRDAISTELATITQKEYLSKQRIKEMSPDISDYDLDKVHTTFNANAEKYGLTEKDKQNRFFAQVLHETGGTLGSRSENLNYSPQGLKKTFRFYKDNPNLAQIHGRTKDKPANEKAIANSAYGNRMGNTGANEGYSYRGMGWMQLTGKENFINAANSMGIPHKELLENRNDVGYQAEAAMSYWRDKNLNEAESIDAATRVINRHTNSYKERRDKYQELMTLASN